MQDAKADSSVLPKATLSNDAVTSERQLVDDAASREADDGSIAPSQTPLLTSETESQISLQRSDDNCDSLSAADTEGLSSLCSTVTSTLSSGAEVTDKAGNAYERIDAVDRRMGCGDELGSSAQAVAAVNVACSAANSAVATCRDAELVSTTSVASSESICQPSDAPASSDMTSHLNLSSILAESFVSSTHSAATVVSTQASVGSPLAVCETSISSGLRSSSAGMCPFLLVSLLHCLLIKHCMLNSLLLAAVVCLTQSSLVET